MARDVEPEDVAVFYGSWKEFSPIALTNLLLTLVTLGIYRFWAINRERQYLWGHTYFFDEELEWTGIGKELFFGFLLAILFLGGPLFLLQFGIQYLVLNGHPTIATTCGLAALLFFNYVIGVARFRALRYRLSRTIWHGINGGSDKNGFAYGLSNLWKWGANYASAGLAIPWTMTTLWNDRWREMSFGQIPFKSDASAKPILAPFFIFYFVPLLLGALSIATLFAQGAAVGNLILYVDAPLWVTLILYGTIALSIYWIIAIIFLNYYAAFYREAVSKLSFDNVTFEFEASAGQWMMLYLVDLLLIIGTLGLGYVFIGYRHWRFFIDHLTVHGEPDTALLQRSQTREPSHGEGLLDAIDIGAF